jgi:outer membrane protein
MKRFTVVVAVVALAAMWALGYAADKTDASSSVGTKIGYVDLNRALNEVNQGKAAKAQLEADGKAKKQKLEIMQNDLRKMKEDLDKQRLILSADAMREKETQFQQKFAELQRTSMDFEREFSEKESTFIKPISDKMQVVIQELGKSEGYTIIIPKEMALYSLPGSDLTDKVITTFNKK